MVNTIAPIVLSGNTVVAVSSEKHPLSAITLSEVLATSDVPGGVINLLTGGVSELGSWAASHQDVNAIDLEGADEVNWVDLEIAAAENLKRVVRPGQFGNRDASQSSLQQILSFLELKTVWHPKGH